MCVYENQKCMKISNNFKWDVPILNVCYSHFIIEIFKIISEVSK